MKWTASHLTCGTILLLVLLQPQSSIAFAPGSRPLFRIGLSPLSAKMDEAAYEADRLLKDAQAMGAMKETAEAEFGALRTPWKWVIRKRIWDYLEENDIARPPRPVHHRIPNFDGADLAAKRLTTLPEFRQAKCVKVNPDTPQKAVRLAVLEQGKILLTPQPRLRTGFFSTLSKDTIPSDLPLEKCCVSVGVAKYGTSVGLNEDYTVDLVVVGSTGVCPKTGARVGKGEGFAELEWGILSAQGNLNSETTLVVTTVHDDQVVYDIPAGQLTKHDVPVDIIVTPTQIIRVSDRVPKPHGIFWDLLSPQKLSKIRVLRQLKKETEQKMGKKLPSGPEEKLPPTASRGANKKKGNGDSNGANSTRNKNDRSPKQKEKSSENMKPTNKRQQARKAKGGPPKDASS